MTRRRLDRELVARGVARDEEEAGRLVEEHRVLIDGAPASKSSTLVSGASNLRLVDARMQFASRGGEKLAGALEDMHLDPGGRKCLDAGAGSGGFTDCLLQRGASEVVAIDVGFGQFDWRLRNDPRVRLYERTNLRTMDPALLGGPFGLVVADLSFISLEAVLDRLLQAAAASGDLLLLVKPQFEAPAGDVPPGGVVTEPAVWKRSIEKVASGLARRGWGITGIAPSRVPGVKGNREFFLQARRGVADQSRELVDKALAEVT